MMVANQFLNTINAVLYLGPNLTVTKMKVPTQSLIQVDNYMRGE
jgi:hypothetical protein